ncbi:hypothetical protein MMC28_008466 [Mycoblastus sanguinarius]|nr:hypothetical protein [Mycoblastus sanguinarius]
MSSSGRDGGITLALDELPRQPYCQPIAKDQERAPKLLKVWVENNGAIDQGLLAFMFKHMHLMASDMAAVVRVRCPKLSWINRHDVENLETWVLYYDPEPKGSFLTQHRAWCNSLRPNHVAALRTAIQNLAMQLRYQQLNIDEKFQEERPVELPSGPYACVWPTTNYL